MSKTYKVISTDDTIDNLELALEQSNGEVLRVPGRELVLTIDGGEIKPVEEAANE